MDLRDVINKHPVEYCRAHDPKGMDRLIWVAYWRIANKFSEYGTAKLVGIPGFCVFLVEKRSKAYAHIYLGKSWFKFGRVWGKTIAFSYRVPAFDFQASLHARNSG